MTNSSPYDYPTTPPPLPDGQGASGAIAEAPRPPVRPVGVRSSWETAEAQPQAQEYPAQTQPQPYLGQPYPHQRYDEQAQARHFPGPIYYPQPPAEVRENGKIATSYAFAAISLLFFPIVFGPVAIWLAHSASKEGDPRGSTAKTAAICCMIGGFVLGAAVAASLAGG